MLISILLSPFTLLSRGLWYQEWLHFLVNFIEFSVKVFHPLDSFHGEPNVHVGHGMARRGTVPERSESAAGNSPEQLWETRGSRLPLPGVFRLWIGIGSLGNLDGPRRRPAGRNRQIFIVGIAVIRKERGYYA
jgi:hypothetical protein